MNIFISTGWQLPLKMTGNIGNGKFAVAGRDIILLIWLKGGLMV